VDDSGQPQQEPDQPSDDSEHGVETEQQSKAPEPAHKAKGYTEASKQLALRYVFRPMGKGVEWLDGHNGLVTSLSTVAIAVLTYFVAVYANGQLGVFRSQLDEMRSTGKQTDALIAVTKQSADAAKLAATAALESNAAVRAQLKGYIIIPDEPDSKIRVGENGAVSVDLYLINTGQSWARDIYANIEIIIKNGQRRIYFAPPVWFGGFDISQNTPWHHTITDFQPLITGQIKNDDLLTIEITIGISYSDVFDEKTSRYFRLKGWGEGDVNSRCCTLKEFEGGLGFQRQAEMSRLPPIPPK
jgi:hypothetical protein